MKHLLILCVLGTLGAEAAPVLVDSIGVSMVNGVLSAAYELEGPAIVTANVETNAGGDAWTRLPGSCVRRLEGDVGLVTSGGAKTLRWKAYKDMPKTRLPAGSVRVVVKAWATNAPPTWMSVDLGKVSDAARYYEDDFALPVPPTDDMWKTESLLLRKIPAAFVEWRMGRSPIEQQVDGSRWDWTPETPHQVTFTRDYYMSVYEMTQRQYMKLMGSNPSQNTATCDTCGDDANALLRRPVDSVSFADATGENGVFAKLRGMTGNGTFNLPSTAEWEFACRAGCTHALYDGTDAIGDGVASENHKAIAWVGSAEYGNGHGHSHPVGLKIANAWGLYDMLGNVDELTRDYLQSDLGNADAVDPEFTTPTADGRHAVCGGNYDRQAYRVRCCCQNRYVGDVSPVCGLRIYCR